MDSLKRLQSLCLEAAAAGASDVFLGEGQAARQRLHGRVIASPDATPITRPDIEALWRACLPLQEPDWQDADAHWDLGKVRFRVNLHQSLGELGAVLRVIHKEIPDMQTLRLPESLLQSWGRRPYGLVLVTGPTGSGKSTTVASLLEWINSWREGHVITIEEPIEFLFTSKKCLFTQREIPHDTPGFRAGLRSALRQSPDIIFMGEIRDFESARIAIQAAETGHLVLSTVHTSTVVETMERLTDLMPEAQRKGVLSLLAAQLIGILSQRLLPASEGGRHVVTEHFQNEGASREWIQEMDYASLADFIEDERGPNALNFQASLLEAWRHGKISQDTALAASASPNQLKRAMSGVS